jgi:hypothetical protein
MVHPGVSALGKKKRITVLPRKSFSDTGFSFSSSKVKSGALSLTSMAFSPSRSRLYSRIAGPVILVALPFLIPQYVCAQSSRSTPKSKGPRATALLQLPENGKPRLIPVCILIDGKFYDAGIYKANPVPMALEGGTVYEAQRTGKPIGLFTVKGVLQQQQTKVWIAEGDWQAEGAAPKKSTALQAEAKPREQEDRPPTLRRPAKAPTQSQSAGNKTPESKPVESTASEAKPPVTTSSAPPPTQSTSSSTASAAPTSSSTSPASTPAPEAAEENDPSRPHLRRGIPAPAAKVETRSAKPSTTAASKAPAAATSGNAAKESASVAAPAKTSELIPAISDADGPEPRPYSLDLKPEEEQGFRKKMLVLATAEVSKQIKQNEPVPERPTPARNSKPGKPIAPKFDDVKLRVFDVATNNEPILVLSATAMPVPSAKINNETGRENYVTVVARTDFNAELHKLLSAVTDSQHLDVTPRMELIDAVDVDGDGRGELLFREVSDAGSAYVVYRVTPDQLWALFEGSPSR